MSEWQPARWRLVHQRPLLSDDDRRMWERKLYHIRPSDHGPHPGSMSYGASVSECNATRFFIVKELCGWLMCEHEVLTD